MISLDRLPRDVSFSRIFGLSQVWSETSSWSCVGDTRSKHGFMYICCDEVLITYKNGEKLAFKHGDLLYLPKYSEYSIRFSKSDTCIHDILLNFDMRDPDGENYAFSDKIECLSHNLPAKLVTKMLEVVYNSVNISHPTLPMTKEFYEFANMLNNHIIAQKLCNDTENPVLPAIVYIDNHILDEFTVPQLAKMCLLNEGAFRKAFQSYTGMNPVQYKQHIKIEKAKIILRNTTEIPVEEIAESLNFYDNSHFHKVFSKFTGTTPKQYREAFITASKTKK